MHFGAQARPQNASDDQDDMRCLGFFFGDFDNEFSFATVVVGGTAALIQPWQTWKINVSILGDWTMELTVSPSKNGGRNTSY